MLLLLTVFNTTRLTSTGQKLKYLICVETASLVSE